MTTKKPRKPRKGVDRHFVLGTLDPSGKTVLVRACGFWADMRKLRARDGLCEVARPGMSSAPALPVVPWASLDLLEVAYPDPTSRTPAPGDTLPVLVKRIDAKHSRAYCVAPEPVFDTVIDGVRYCFYPGFCMSMADDPWRPVRRASVAPQAPVRRRHPYFDVTRAFVAVRPDGALFEVDTHEAATAAAGEGGTVMTRQRYLAHLAHWGSDRSEAGLEYDPETKTIKL